MALGTWPLSEHEVKPQLWVGFGIPVRCGRIAGSSRKIGDGKAKLRFLEAVDFVILHQVLYKEDTISGERECRWASFNNCFNPLESSRQLGSLKLLERTVLFILMLEHPVVQIRDG